MLQAVSAYKNVICGGKGSEKKFFWLCCDPSLCWKSLICWRSDFTNSAVSSAAWSKRCQFRNSLGRLSDCPYTSSAVIPWMSSFQAERIPRSTVDKVSLQRVSLWHIIAALSWRCRRSTKPFVHGWYAVILRWVVPNTQLICLNRYNSNTATTLSLPDMWRMSVVNYRNCRGEHYFSSWRRKWLAYGLCIWWTIFLLPYV